MEENIQDLMIIISLVLAGFSFIWHWRNILHGKDKLNKKPSQNKTNEKK
ncbi:MAG TPA: hypothetical protein VMZ91_01290 [Candidatus Paceibacterota bacterium]|nr:hypothetical protein [Candidatus Paceibacterota bacterium]